MALPIETKAGSLTADYTRISGERPQQCKAMISGVKARICRKYGPKTETETALFWA
jgi:hypothetical protein